jgi:hypothetical protein
MADAAVMEKITHRLKCKELERAIRKELYTMRSVDQGPLPAPEDFCLFATWFLRYWLICAAWLPCRP